MGVTVLDGGLSLHVQQHQTLSSPQDHVSTRGAPLSYLVSHQCPRGTPFQCGPEYIEADAYLSVSKHVNDRLKRLRNRLGRPPFLKPYSPVEDEEDVAACFKQPSTLRLKYHRRPPSLYEDSNSVGRHPP
ncbi:MAG: hypothetical protein QXP19_01530 [Thermoproteota archaeon]